MRDSSTSEASVEKSAKCTGIASVFVISHQRLPEDISGIPARTPSVSPKSWVSQQRDTDGLIGISQYVPLMSTDDVADTSMASKPFLQCNRFVKCNRIRNFDKDKWNAGEAMLDVPGYRNWG